MFDHYITKHNLAFTSWSIFFITIYMSHEPKYIVINPPTRILKHLFQIQNHSPKKKKVHMVWDTCGYSLIDIAEFKLFLFKLYIHIKTFTKLIKLNNEFFFFI